MLIYSYQELCLEQFKRTKNFPKFGGCVNYDYEDFICRIDIQQNRDDKSIWDLRVMTNRAFSINSRVVGSGCFNSPLEALKAAEKIRQSIIETVFTPYKSGEDQRSESLSLLFQHSPIPKKLTL